MTTGGRVLRPCGPGQQRADGKRGGGGRIIGAGPLGQDDGRQDDGGNNEEGSEAEGSLNSFFLFGGTFWKLIGDFGAADRNDTLRLELFEQGCNFMLADLFLEQGGLTSCILKRIIG